MNNEHGVKMYNMYKKIILKKNTYKGCAIIFIYVRTTLRCILHPGN